MEGVLYILAIAALTAAIDAEFLVFTKNDFDSLQLTDPKEESCETEIINVYPAFQYRPVEKRPDEAIFEEVSVTLPLPEDKLHPICEDHPGIHIKATNQIFCGIKTFSMKLLKNQSDKEYIEFTLFMESKEKRPFALIVPVLKEFESGNEEIKPPYNTYEDWANGEQVGLKTPLVDQNIQMFDFLGTLDMGFRWLEKLLKHRVTKSLEQTTMPGKEEKIMTYATRPILASERHLEMCKRTIAARIKSSGSDSLGDNPWENQYIKEEDSISIHRA